MKRLLSVIALGIFFTGCTTFNNQLPAPQAAMPTENSRNVAQAFDYLEQQYTNYFAAAPFYERLLRLEKMTIALHDLMEESGNSKKKFVAQFQKDLRKELNAIGRFPSSATDKAASWLPSEQPDPANYRDKVLALGRVEQSFAILNESSAFLDRSGVFEKDGRIENFYLSLIGRAAVEINLGLQEAVVYKPEIKLAQLNGARLKHSKKIVVEIREAMRKVFPSVRDPQYVKTDLFFDRVAKTSSIEQIRTLIRSNDFVLAKNIMQDVQLINSGEINGFQDQVDLTLATKFNFQMLVKLVTPSNVK